MQIPDMLSLSNPRVAYHADRVQDDATSSDPLALLIDAEQELDFNHDMEITSND